jgi:hypothetical protein
MNPQSVRLLGTDGNVVRCQKQPRFIFVKGQLVGTDLPNLASHPRFVEGQNGITPRSNHKPSLPARPTQRVPKQYRATITLQQVHVIDDHRDNGPTERLTDLLPQLPLVNDLRWIEADNRAAA